MNADPRPTQYTEDAKAIGARVRELRHQKGLTLTDLAHQASVSKSYLSAVENGSGSRPGAAVLHKLATTLGVTIADFLGRTVHATEQGGDISLSLLRFAETQGLPQADIDMLAGIKFRGEAPHTQERWQFIYNAIVMSAQSEGARSAKALNEP